MQLFHRLALAAALAAAAMSAQAALINRGGGMIYDDVQNITWLADWNYAQTSGYAAANEFVDLSGSNTIRANGRMGWGAANNWAANLVYGGFDDWRLATTNTTASSNCDRSSQYPGFPDQYEGANCTGSEMGYMFYNYLGGNVNESVLDQTGDTAQEMTNLALFSNVQVGPYWTATEFEPDPIFAWRFFTNGGYQFAAAGKEGTSYAVAVRSGDVVAAVPEPQTLALALLALGAAMMTRQRQPRPRQEVGHS